MTELIRDPVSWYVAIAGVYLLLGSGLLIGGSILLRRQVMLVSLAGIGWAVYRLFGPEVFSGVGRSAAAFFVEAVFMLAWFGLLYRLLRGPYRQSMPETVRRYLYLFWGLIFTVAALVAWFSYIDALGGGAATYYHVLGLSISLAGFGLSAQLNRDAPVENTLTLSALAIASGVIFASQVLWFGVATLTGSASQGYDVFRLLAAGIAGLILLYAVRRRPQWSLDIFVSPQSSAYVPRLLAVLAFLGALLALTPISRSLVADNLQLFAGVLITLVGVPVTVLMFSENLSARLRVFISKHFLPFRFDYREEWLRLIDTLSAPDQRLPLPERSIKAVAQIVNAPAGLLWWRVSDEEPYRCIASWNTRLLPDTEVRADDPALVFMHERQWILDTAELDRDPELYEGLRRPAWAEQLPSGLLVVPLFSNEALFGFIVLLQSSSAFRLAFEEIDLLRTSGRQVAAHLAQYQADKQLAEVQQFEAFNRLTAFVMHDLKNLIAQQSLMVKNAAKHKGNPEFFEDAMATIENSVARMNKLLRQLQSGDAAGPVEIVNLSEALSDAIRRTENRQPQPDFDGQSERLSARINREGFSAVVAHLIRNAQDATSPKGSVVVSLRNNASHAEVCIADDGCGMSADFIRTRLFRPFDSTKGSKGMGIGAYQARTFIVDAGGAVQVDSKPEQGTRVIIRLPLVG